MFERSATLRKQKVAARRGNEEEEALSSAFEAMASGAIEILDSTRYHGGLDLRAGGIEGSLSVVESFEDFGLSRCSGSGRVSGRKAESPGLSLGHEEGGGEASGCGRDSRIRGNAEARKHSRNAVDKVFGRWRRKGQEGQAAERQPADSPARKTYTTADLSACIPRFERLYNPLCEGSVAKSHGTAG
ncbi:hypothetical protein KM043_008413 [Ampulex compressa]|nr:hypothetical protein KM043_008413 [Ampulex compressa]